VNSYGGASVELTHVNDQGCLPALGANRRSPGTSERVAAPSASTYTPEEARMAEQYARDAMADAAASDDRHYRSH
jgi:hypothetical protein